MDGKTDETTEASRWENGISVEWRNGEKGNEASLLTVNDKAGNEWTEKPMRLLKQVDGKTEFQ